MISKGKRSCRSLFQVVLRGLTAALLNHGADMDRGGHAFVPQPETRIEAGDELLIVTTTKARDAAERRLRAVSRRGKLAHWFDEYGEPD